jgi:hypothetical protein
MVMMTGCLCLGLGLGLGPGLACARSLARGSAWGGKRGGPTQVGIASTFRVTTSTTYEKWHLVPCTQYLEVRAVNNLLGPFVNVLRT